MFILLLIALSLGFVIGYAVAQANARKEAEIAERIRKAKGGDAIGM